jgi:hypothetical protein
VRAPDVAAVGNRRPYGGDRGSCCVRAEFFYWPLPEYVWQLAVGAALLAMLLGIWAAVRKRRLARLVGIVAIALGLFVLGFIAFIVATYED